MTALDPRLTADDLDDEQQRTPAWEDLREQTRKAGTVPRGTYEATLREVAVIRRRDGAGFALRMIARTDRLGRYVLSWRGLADDPVDPYALTEAQVRSLRKFAGSMGIQTPAPAQAIVDALGSLLGEAVIAKVYMTPVGQQTTLTREVAAPTLTQAVLVNGHVVDENGEVSAAHAAYHAHECLLEGLSAARFGLARAAEGAHTLQKTEGWTALGFESLSEYLASPEVTLSRSEFYRLAAIWDAYVLAGGMAPERLQGAGPSKLEVPLPALEQGVVSAEQAAADAESMTRKDLRAHYAALLGEEPEDGGGSCDGSPASSERRQQDGASVPVGVARTLTGTLQRVMVEVGAPEKKRMSRELREAVLDTLALAHEHGLDTDSEL